MIHVDGETLLRAYSIYTGALVWSGAIRSSGATPFSIAGNVLFNLASSSGEFTKVAAKQAD